MDIMDVAVYRRNSPEGLRHDISLARHLTKKLATRNKQLKLLAGCVRQFDHIFSSQEYIVEQLTHELASYKEGRSKGRETPSNPFREENSKIQKRRGRSLHKSVKEPIKREDKDSKKWGKKSKTQEDDKNIKLPKLTPQKQSALNFEEQPSFGKGDRSPFSQKKIVKIPMHRLVPVSYEDIRRRIESKHN